MTVARLPLTKHIDILIKASNKHKFNLKIVGDGRDKKYLESIAGEKVEFLGEVSDKKLSQVYAQAKAFLFSAVDEEFGIALVEAMGYGLPVIAYSSGGVKETVNDNKNGFLYHKLNKDSLIKKTRQLEGLSKEKYLKLNLKKPK